MRRAALTLLIALSLGACSGLSGEPQIMATVAPRQSVESVATTVDVWQPDIVNGARIYAERCTECHGINGNGRGDLVQARSVEQPLDMTDRGLVSVKSPLEWYEIITRGRIENLMPPWENALSDRERWDVALYAYSLSYDDELLAEGEALWRERCSDCELPAVIPPVFSDVDYGVQLKPEGFDVALREAEIGAAVAYARMYSLTDGGGFGQADQAASASQKLGEIAGRLEHGTEGGVVPAGTLVQLQYGSGESGFNIAETTVNEDLRFSFGDIPLTSEFSYVVGAVYDGRLFSRRLPASVTAASANDQTITLYDQIQDPQVVSITRIDVFVEAVTLTDWGPGLYVSQIIGFHNDSDRIYSSGRRFDDGREAVLLLQFPLGARPISSDEYGRFVVIKDMENLPDSVIDTQPVTPGDSHQVVLEYFLPFERELKFEQAFNNLIDADVSVTLSPGLDLEGEMLALQDESAATGDLRVYAGQLKMDSEPRFSFDISGNPFATSSDDRAVITSDSLPALMVGAVAIAVALLAAVGILRRRGDDASSDIDGLVADLARLDEDHDRGRINHDLYHHRRRELKAKLAALMATEE